MFSFSLERTLRDSQTQTANDVSAWELKGGLAGGAAEGVGRWAALQIFSQENLFGFRELWVIFVGSFLALLFWVLWVFFS